VDWGAGALRTFGSGQQLAQEVQASHSASKLL
jgi:hypothetical protein